MLASDGTPYTQVAIISQGAAAATNRSGTVETGGSAQQLAAANTGRKGFVLANKSAGTLMVNDVGTASASAGFPVPPGGLIQWKPDGSYVPAGALSIWGASTGQAFEAREW